MDTKLNYKRSLYIKDYKKQIKHLKRINFIMFVGYMTSLIIILYFYKTL